MPRKPIIRSNSHYYHLTGRSNNKENFYIHKDHLWKQFNFCLRQLQLEYDLKVGAFVLMDNHFHLLLMTPKEDIDRIMFLFMWRLSQFIRKKSGRINRIFGARYKGCLIEEEEYLFNVYKYIYRNPVKAGLCQRIEDYNYSSWNTSTVEVENLFFAKKFSTGELKWLNLEFEQKRQEGIQKCLKRTIFEPPKNLKLDPFLVY